MNAVFRTELRHIAKSPFLWIGVLVALSWYLRSLRGLWPVVPGDDALAWHAGLVLSGFLLIAAARIGARDRRCGLRVLVASTISAEKVAAYRMLATGLAGIASFVLLFAFGLGASVFRGGRGIPDFRLLADGALAALLASWLGFVLGSLTRSPAILLAAPVYAFISFSLGTAPVLVNHRLSFEWISPNPRVPDRSVAAGFLPDVITMHSLYLAGLVASVAGVVLLVSRASFRRVKSRIIGVGTVTAATMAVVTAVALVRAPDAIQLGSDGRIELFHSTTAQYVSREVPLDATKQATLCKSGTNLRVCVYPAYGDRFAARLFEALQPEADLFAGFPGIARTVRMVPASGFGCRGRPGEAVISEDRNVQSWTVDSLRGFLVHCALINIDRRFASLDEEDNLTAAQNAVELWTLLVLGEVSDPELQAALSSASPGTVCPPQDRCAPRFDAIYSHGPGAWSAAEIAVARQMHRTPARETKNEIRRVWDQLLSGEMSLSSLTEAVR